MGVGNRSEKRLETALLDTREGEQRHCVPEAGNRRPHTTALSIKSSCSALATVVHFLGFSQQVSNRTAIQFIRGPTQAVTIANFFLSGIAPGSWLFILFDSYCTFTFSLAPWNSSN